MRDRNGNQSSPGKHPFPNAPGGHPVIFELRLGIGLLASVLVILLNGCEPKNTANKLERAEKLLTAGEIQEAKKTASEISRDDIQWAAAQFLLGTIEWNEGSQQKACEHFDQIPSNGDYKSLQAAELAAGYYLKNCQLSKAAEKLEYVVRENPESDSLRATLATILVVGGRRSRADVHLMHLLRKGRIELKELVLLTQPNRLPPESDTFLQCRDKSNNDAMTNYAMASLAMANKQLESAISQLRTAVAVSPGFVEAQAMLGELLLNMDVARFEGWMGELPDDVINSPDVWFVRGLYSRRTGQLRPAIRCFWETIKKDPLHRRAMYQLGQCLSGLDLAASQDFSGRSDSMAACEVITERVLIDHGQKTEEFQQLIRILMDSGRQFEAAAWIQQVGDDRAVNRIPQETLDLLTGLRGLSKPRFTIESDLAKKHDYSSFPVPKLSGDLSSRSQSSSKLQRQISFSDSASARGLQFTYHHSPESRSGRVRVFESTGGGTGVLDFDEDHRPDVFLTQGEKWPHGHDRPQGSIELHDCLFRQYGTGFVDVSAAAGINPEDGYGQGCSAGDFDNDGFQDLYVANIGTNRLLANNGDGTFSDVTRDANIFGSSWTTSCLILDLNGDSHPDLYDVNYLSGNAIHRVECGESECSIRNFQGAEDLVQISNGDGTFRVISNATPKENSKGLGLSALYPSSSDLPSLFIANDQVPNYFLIPHGDGTYTDEAGLRGVAVNVDGRPTACMGVAAGDVNGDQRQDLFVTNFESEANCLYLQTDDGFFFDSIRGTGLMAAGIPYVGWGTQFFDADNDCLLDLAVANGHVADFGKQGRQYFMPTQFFRGKGNSEFEEIPASDLGLPFEKLILGRSLAVLDWNLDGRQDFLISPVGTPAMLITNETKPPGHFIRFKLHAKNTARDSQGATVSLETIDSRLWQQLNGGDGYQTSNEKKLHFGLDHRESVKAIVVSWPSGAKDTFQIRHGVDKTYDLVEGKGIFHYAESQ